MKETPLLFYFRKYIIKSINEGLLKVRNNCLRVQVRPGRFKGVEDSYISRSCSVRSQAIYKGKSCISSQSVNHKQLVEQGRIALECSIRQPHVGVFKESKVFLCRKYKDPIR